MNKIKIITSIMFIVLSVSVLAQNTQDTVKSEKKESIIKIAPGRLAFGDFLHQSFSLGVGYEFVNTDRRTTHIGAYVVFIDNIFEHEKWFLLNTKSLFGIFVYGEHRYYFFKQKKVMNAPYIAGDLKMYYTNSIVLDQDVSSFLLSPHIIIGVQDHLTWSGNFIFDLGVGLGFKYGYSSKPFSSSIQRWYVNANGNNLYMLDFCVNFKIGYLLNNKI